jgi:hypothetical protein
MPVIDRNMHTNEMAKPPFIPSMPKIPGAKTPKTDSSEIIAHAMAVCRGGLSFIFTSNIKAILTQFNI